MEGKGQTFTAQQHLVNTTDVSPNLWIGDLPGEFTEEQLNTVFGVFGTIKRSKLLEAKAGGRRAALLEYETVDEAKWIVENLNGSIPQGMTEPVAAGYKPFGAKSLNAGLVAASAPQHVPPPPVAAASQGESDNLWIGDLPGSMDEAACSAVFGAYGEIRRCKVLPVGHSGKCSALVQFGTVAEAKWFCENLHNNIPQGLNEPVQVNYNYQGGGAGTGKSGKSGKDKDKGKGGGYGAWDSKGFTVGGRSYSSSPYSSGKSYDSKGKGGCTIRELVIGVEESGALPTNKQPTDCTLWIGGLPRDTTDVDVYRIFSPFGSIIPRGVKATLEDDMWTCKGFGFVTYIDPASAHSAIDTLNGTQMPDGTVMKVSIKRQKDAKADKGGKGKW